MSAPFVLDMPSIRRMIDELLDKWDKLPQARRDLSVPNMSSLAFAALATCEPVVHAVVAAHRVRVFSGLSTVRTEGDVEPPECIRAIAQAARNARRSEMRSSALRPIGRGAFGTVFKHPSRPGRVLKVIESTGNPEEALHEAKITKAAADAGVAPAFHGMTVCCGAKGECVLILEMDAVAETLRAWMRKAQTPAARLKMLRAIDALLQRLHDEGIMHNDVHMDNILVAKGNKPLLIDFGLALRVKPVGSRTSRGAVVEKQNIALRREHAMFLKEIVMSRDKKRRANRWIGDVGPTAWATDMRPMISYVITGLAKESVVRE
jgi:tRNA A-37 threonylcarbamoyl transferase component Bud32